MEWGVKVKGEEQVYLQEFLSAEYKPRCEQGDFQTTSGCALFSSTDLLV